jgi:hypothetical protein
VRVSWRAFWAAKDSCAEEEYEDAFASWPRGGRQLDGVIGDRFSFAVADGATASSHSRLWARQLVLGFVTGKLSEDHLSEGLSVLRERWRKKVPEGTQPWWAEQSLERGAFAALVGLRLKETGHNPSTFGWTALAVGDSCLVHMHERNVKVTFPIDRADQFGTTPVLLATDARAVESALAERKSIKGVGVPGDRFYLMTDALAEWFLKDFQRGGEPWAVLQDFDLAIGAPPFREWLTDTRRQRLIRNDDVTLLRIEVL